MSQRVIVTGASGHVGFHVARELRRRGFPTHLLIRSRNVNVQMLEDKYGAHAHVVDFSSPADLARHLAGADCLFHHAAMNTTRQRGGDEILRSTTDLTERLLQTACDRGVPTVIYTSSVVVLGRSRDPDRLIIESDRTETEESPYVRGKVRAEKLCDALVAEGLDVRRLYPSWVVGPHDLKHTPPQQTLQRFLDRGSRFYFGGGLSIAAVEQVAKAHVQAWLSGSRGGKYVLGGENITFEEFFRLLAEFTCRRQPSIKLPKSMMRAAAALLRPICRSLGVEPLLDPGYVDAVVDRYSWYDSSKAQRELGYVIPSARVSLQRAVRWERQKRAGVHGFVDQPVSATDHSQTAKPRLRHDASRLLITGVPGWLGNCFLEYFLSQPCRPVRLLVEPRFADLFDLPAPFEVAAADITDPAAVGRAVAGVGAVFHLAGAIYPRRAATLYRVNEQGTRNLIDRCIDHGVRRILFMSTDSVCGRGSKSARLFAEDAAPRPYRHYGRSKWLAERYLFEKTAAGLIDGTALRGFWFFGPHAPARQARFFEMLSWKRQLVFGNGRNYRSISHTQNLVQAFLAAEPRPETFGKWYWIGDRRHYTVDEIYRRLCEAKSAPFRPLHVPRPACAALRWFDGCLQKVRFIHPTAQALGKFTFDIAGSIEAAERDFGYRPAISLETDPAAYLGEPAACASSAVSLQPDASDARAA